MAPTNTPDSPGNTAALQEKQSNSKTHKPLYSEVRVTRQGRKFEVGREKELEVRSER
jgi:hypothetical protein